MRCFVAVDVSPAVRERLAAVQATLRKDAAEADVRWADPGRIHLTLKFLGEVPDAQVPAVRAAVEAAAGGSGPIRLDARGVGAFPNARRPRVVWAGVTGDVDGLVRLAAAVEATVARLGYPAEARPFRAHLTLGRVRSPRVPASLVTAMAEAASVELGSWSVPDVVLYRSHLRPTGAVYEPLARVELAGRRA
jgi:2'-5' RNA ligase